MQLFIGCRRSPSSEVWIIGLDGADWNILDPLIEAGALPNIAALRDESAWGVLLSDEPMLSPILWTSIATGKTPDQHGVTWFMSDAPDGTKIPVSSRDRRNFLRVSVPVISRQVVELLRDDVLQESRGLLER